MGGVDPEQEAPLHGHRQKHQVGPGKLKKLQIFTKFIGKRRLLGFFYIERKDAMVWFLCVFY